MLPVIGNHSYKIMHGRGTPSGVYHTVEDIAKPEGRAYSREDIHDMLQWWSFAVPDNADRYYFRPIHQSPAYLNFCSTRTLGNKEK